MQDQAPSHQICLDVGILDLPSGVRGYIHYGEAAAHAVSHSGRLPGSEVRWSRGSSDWTTTVDWPQTWPLPTENDDPRDVVEHGAVGVVLAWYLQGEGRQVKRRLPVGVHADWVLGPKPGCEDRELYVEVSGTMKGSLAGRLQEKVQQVDQADYSHRAAAVVRFESLEAAIHNLDQED